MNVTRTRSRDTRSRVGTTTRHRTIAKALSTAKASKLVNMSNLSSVKTILMAMQVSLKYAEAVFSHNKENMNRIKRIGFYISRLNALADSLHTDEYVDPEILYRELRLCSIAYVNLFYGASENDRNAFMSAIMSDGIGKNLSNENNIVLLPSMLAANNIPIGKASFSILTGVHRKSFLVIKQAIKSMASIELFRNSTALGGTALDLDLVNKRLYEIDGMIENMHGLVKSYDVIETKKLELMQEMHDIGESTGFPIDNVIESISAPYNAKRSSIIRK